jgi:hypothetical protein
MLSSVSKVSFLILLLGWVGGDFIFEGSLPREVLAFEKNKECSLLLFNEKISSPLKLN